MRVLVLDVCAEYANPTRSLLVRVLAQAADAIFFGPGYVSSNILRRGLREFIKRRGPFDLLVTNEHFAFSDVANAVDLPKGYRRNYIIRFPFEDLALRRSALKELMDLPIPKAVTLLESDYYNFSDEQVDIINNNFNLVIGWGEQFFRRRNDLPDLERERFSSRVNDNWFDFVTSNRKRIVPLVHFVADNEFCYTALSHRPADWSVPGVPYHLRARAKQALSHSGGSLSRGKPLPVAPLLTRLGLRPFSWPLFQRYYQERFREEIRQSRFSFTCGSALQWPIRKYFEIPALGAILVCRPCNGFEALGFRNGENAIACEPEDLPALGKRLLANLDEAQAIADAGRRLVSAKHTVSARAVQLRQAFEAFLDGRWHGGTWSDGDIVPSAELAVSADDKQVGP